MNRRPSSEEIQAAISDFFVNTYVGALLQCPEAAEPVEGLISGMGSPMSRAYSFIVRFRMRQSPLPTLEDIRIGIQTLLTDRYGLYPSLKVWESDSAIRGHIGVRGVSNSVWASYEEDSPEKSIFCFCNMPVVS